MTQTLARWLGVREPFDAIARSAALTQLIALALPRRRTLRVLDLGTGTGSNVRYIAPQLGGEQRWTLVDKDPAVLARIDGNVDVPYDTVQINLGACDRPDIFEGIDLVTAAALLDLVSEPFLGWLAHRCRGAGALALFALTYTGRSTCTPAEPEDDDICELLNRHQRQCDKGFGAAAGPGAVDAAERAFTAAGYRVERAESDWLLPPDAYDLQRELMQGWADAALELQPAESTMIDDWLARRVAHLDAGRSRIVVSHEDLAAFPS